MQITHHPVITPPETPLTPPTLSPLSPPSPQSASPPSPPASPPPPDLHSDEQLAYTAVERPLPASYTAASDWRFDRTEFLRYSATYGPFSIESTGMSLPALLSTDVSSATFWCIPPFKNAAEVLAHYKTCKSKAPSTTSAVFVLPNLPGFDALTADFKLVYSYPSGLSLFTKSSPTDLDPTRRVPIGPLPFGMCVYHDPPAPASPQAPSPPTPVPPIPPLEFVSKAVCPSDHDSSPLLVLIGECNGKSVRILIDSGATRDFVGYHALTRMGLTTSSLAEPLRVKLADGSISTTATSAHISYSLADFDDSRTFVATTLDGVDMIFGKPWMAQFNPDINWTTNTVHTPFHLEAVTSPCTPTLQFLSATKMAKVLRNPSTQLFIGTIKDIPDSSSPPPDPMKPATTLSPQSEHQLHELLRQFAPSFAEPTGVNVKTGVYHTIPLVLGAEPPVHGMRRMSPAELAELQKQLTWYLDRGWIRPSTSAFGAPVVFAKKADGTLRFCLDYRALNNITIKNRYPLPKIDELLDQLHGAKYFTSLDLSSAYHQIPMAPEDIHKTAFRTRYGHYEFTVMPFGLTNAPATCQAVMNDVLRPYLDKFASIYLDDCMIWSKTEAEHLQHIRLVLEAFTKANLHLKITKCSFAKPSTKFLGFIVSSDGIAMDPKKLSSIVNWDPPTSVTEVRRFLGFCNFYRRFVKDYSTIAAPLTSLTSALKPFPPTLPPDALDAFTQLKTVLTTAPVLCIPLTGPDATFDLYTDASRVGLGAVLEQDKHPVCFESRKLSPAEQNYPVHELELLAVVHALKMFRHYLEGCKHFTLFTDHHSIQYLFRQKDLSRRQAGWLETLVDFQPNMEIRYLPGEKNRADALSRHLNSINLCSMFEVFTPSLSLSIASAYSSDPYYTEKKLPSWISKGTDGLYFFRDRICVPADNALRTRILAEFHDSPSAGHPGYLRTLNAVAAHYWWPRMTDFVRRYVASCSTCQRIKPSTQAPAGLLQPHAVPTRPWSHISMDLITDLPVSVSHDGQQYDAIATFVDLLTKQAFFVRTTKTVTATGLAHLYLDNVYRLKGLSKFIVSDRDTRITSEFWQTLFRRLGSTLNLSTAHHPQTDGQTEITHRTIEQILRAYVTPEHDDWATWLPVAEFAYNSSTHSSISTTPFEANYGYKPSTPATLDLPATCPSDYASKLQDIHVFIRRQSELAKARQAEQANKHRRDVTFQPGDKVMLSSEKLTLKEQPSKKLRDRWLGPFTVEKVVSPVAYRLILPSQMAVHPTFHVSRLHPAVESPAVFSSRPAAMRPIPTAADFSYSARFAVEALLDVRINPETGRSLQFKVRWAAPHNDPALDTWEPLRHVSHLDVFSAFLLSPVYARFSATPEFRQFARSYARSVPRLPVLPV